MPLLIHGPKAAEDIVKKRGRRKLSLEIIEEIKRLRERGIASKEIARKLKLGVSTVYRYLEIKKREGFFKKLKRKLG